MRRDEEWTAMDLNRAIAWEEDGLTHAAIGRRLGRTRAAVSAALLRARPEVRRMPKRAVWTREADRRKFLEAHARGLCPAAISRATGFPLQTIAKWYPRAQLTPH